MDKFEQLAKSADFPVGVFGDAGTMGPFTLVDLTVSPLESLARKTFICVLGLIDNQPRAACAVLVPQAVIDAVSARYIEHVLTMRVLAYMGTNPRLQA